MQIPEGISLEAFTKAQYDVVLEQSQDPDIRDIILSSETFITPLTTQSVGRLRQLMHGLNCSTITVLTYVRDPSAWFLSSTQQKLKKGYPLSDAFPPISRQWVVRSIRSYSMLEGAEMMVRCFDRSQLVAGDVVMDFMASIGHGDFPLDHNAKPQNVSLSMEAMRYLANHNTRIPESQRELKTRRRMVKKLSLIDARLKAPTKPELRSAARDYIYAKDAGLIPLQKDYKVEFPGVDYSALSEETAEDPLHVTSLDDLCEHNEGRLKRLSLQMKLPLAVIKIMAKVSKLGGALRRPRA